MCQTGFVSHGLCIILLKDFHSAITLVKVFTLLIRYIFKINLNTANVYPVEHTFVAYRCFKEHSLRKISMAAALQYMDVKTRKMRTKNQ